LEQYEHRVSLRCQASQMTRQNGGCRLLVLFIWLHTMTGDIILFFSAWL